MIIGNEKDRSGYAVFENYKSLNETEQKTVIKIQARQLTDYDTTETEWHRILKHLVMVHESYPIDSENGHYEPNCEVCKSEKRYELVVSYDELMLLNKIVNFASKNNTESLLLKDVDIEIIEKLRNTILY